LVLVLCGGRILSSNNKSAPQVKQKQRKLPLQLIVYTGATTAAMSVDSNSNTSLSTSLLSSREEIITPLIAAFMKSDNNSNNKRTIQLMIQKEEEQVVTLHPHDVVVDWGNVPHSSGNEWYKTLIEKKRLSATAEDDDIKPWITKVIVQAVHQQGVPYGRFLNRIQAIRVFAVRVTPIFANKKHALNN
jgi:hypothetical protein